MSQTSTPEVSHVHWKDFLITHFSQLHLVVFMAEDENRGDSNPVKGLRAGQGVKA